MITSVLSHNSTIVCDEFIFKKNQSCGEMRVFVRLGNNSPVVVPVQKEQKVSELLSEALRRLTPTEDKKDEEFDVRLAVNDALLVPSDTAQDVLSDGDHVTIG